VASTAKKEPSMTNPDQERTLQLLAEAIRHCVEILGPACVARLLGTIALDLAEADPQLRKPDPHNRLTHGLLRTDAPSRAEFFALVE
jgi:hypothetical protein